MAEFFKAKQNKLYSEEVEYIDYKDVKTLQKYVDGMGKIDSRKKTGASMKDRKSTRLNSSH